MHCTLIYSVTQASSIYNILAVFLVLFNILLHTFKHQQCTNHQPPPPSPPSPPPPSSSAAAAATAAAAAVAN